VNLAQIKGLGVTGVAFHKPRGLDMAGSARLFKKAARIPGGDRRNNLRCTWRSFEPFIARKLLAST
jgi:hypothetical protein